MRDIELLACPLPTVIAAASKDGKIPLRFVAEAIGLDRNSQAVLVQDPVVVFIVKDDGRVTARREIREFNALGARFRNDPILWWRNRRHRSPINQLTQRRRLRSYATPRGTDPAEALNLTLIRVRHVRG